MVYVAKFNAYLLDFLFVLRDGLLLLRHDDGSVQEVLHRLTYTTCATDLSGLTSYWVSPDE